MGSGITAPGSGITTPGIGISDVFHGIKDEAFWINKILRDKGSKLSSRLEPGARFSKVLLTTGPVNLAGQLPGLVYVPEFVFLEAHVNLPLIAGP